MATETETSSQNLTLTVKTLSNKKFSVTVQTSISVAELKEMLEKEYEMGDAKLLKTIHHGKILKDKMVLSELKISNNDILVVMQSRRKKKQKTKPAPAAQPAVQPTTQPQASAPQAAANTGTDASASTTTTEQPASTEPTGDSTASTTDTNMAEPPAEQGNASGNGMATGSQFEEMITRLTGMGFERSQAEAALRAAYGNPDRATEYLLNGLPANVQVQPQPANTGAQPSEQPNGSAAPNAQGQGVQINPDMLRAALPQILAQMAQTNPELANNPQAIQAMLQNPQMLQSLMGVVANMQAQGGGGQGQGLPTGPPSGGGQPQAQTIQISAEDREALNTLMAMGFTQHQAYEAYRVSGNNLDAAASYLFDNYGG